MIFSDEQRAGNTTVEPSSARVSPHDPGGKSIETSLPAEWLAGIIDSAIDGLIIIDEGRRVILFNRAAEAMFACPAAEAIGQPIDRFLPNRFLAPYREQVSSFGETSMARRTLGVLREMRGLRADGEEVSIEATITQVGAAGQKLYAVSLRDVTLCKNMEKELRDLSGRLIRVQDAERRRIARELHDDLNQRMAMLSIELHQLEEEIPKRQSRLHARVQELWARAQEISSEIHRMSYRLHPSKLDHLGLVSAVKGLCEELFEHQGLKVEFRQAGFPAELPRETRLCIYRIAQETLQNVARHSGVSKALVVLEKDEESIRLSVSDEGCGFDEERARSKRGLGLISMRERLRLIGGTISIDSQISKGTKIVAMVPLSPGEAPPAQKKGELL